MPADTFGVPMLNGGEKPAPAIVGGKYFRVVGATHDIGSSSNDLAAVLNRPPLGNAMRREQIIFLHDAQNPLTADPDALNED